MLAILATIIWSGNFIIARGVHHRIPPVSLAFYRWICATVVLLPFAIKAVRAEAAAIGKSLPFFLLAGLTGITLFNTFVYIGGHYTTAINLALIGTTSSPIISVILAGVFLKEKIGPLKITGMLICVCGVLYLLSRGDFRNLLSLQFTLGDLWVLAAGFVFSIYNTLVKRKPKNISPISFLFVAFAIGTVFLVPFYVWELTHTAAATQIEWDGNLISVILYLGIGASVIAFLLWNVAISKLGSGRTALFGNLIPVFSIIEAILILGESITWIHVISFAIVIIGLVIANQD